jgi:hypothetical protein
MLHPHNLLLAAVVRVPRDDGGGVQGLLCGRGPAADRRHDHQVEVGFARGGSEG